MIRATTILPWAIGTLGLACFSFGQEGDADHQQDSAIELKHGVLQQAPQQIADLFTFRWKNGQLELDKNRWQKITQESGPSPVLARMGRRSLSVRQLQMEWAVRPLELVAEALGGRGMSGFGGGSSGYELRIQAPDTALLASSKNQIFRLEIIETAAPFQSIQYVDFGDGDFRMTVTCQACWMLIQQSDNQAKVAYQVNSQNARSFQGNSFADIVRRDSVFSQPELKSILSHFGIGNPLGPHDPLVRQRVIQQVSAMRPDRQEFAQTLRQLTGESFAERQSAYEFLKSNYQAYRILIADQLASPELSVEARKSLNKICEEVPKDDNADEVILAFALLTDADYLFSLIDPDRPDQSDAHLYQRLRAATGQDFGQEHAAWEDWLQSRRP